MHVFQEPAVQVEGLLQDRRRQRGGAARPAGETDGEEPEAVRLLRLPLLLQVLKVSMTGLRGIDVT